MKKYEESEQVQQLQAQLAAVQAEKPEAYSSQWQSKLDALLDQILNRQAFSYDLDGDTLYRQYRQLYQNQGAAAMADTYGQASALTGGYGNSYAATAARQAYQSSLQQLSEKLPQLYSLALERYSAAGSDLQNRYNLLQQQETADFDRYRQNLSDYQAKEQQLYDRYQDQRSFDYDRFTDSRDFDYRTHRDQVSDSQWQKEFDEAVRQFNSKRR